VRAALVACAAALCSTAAQVLLAHGPNEPHAAPAAAPGAPTVVRNRWGPEYFPNFELTTQDGVKVRFYDDLLKGKSVALNVFYTSCKDECPLETATLAQLQRLIGARAGKDIFFYSISIDPQTDTPAVMKAYAEKFDGGPGWLFLTGNAKEIRVIARKLGLTRSRDRDTRDGHSPILMIGNEPTGQWMRNSAVDNPAFLAATVHTFFGWNETGPQKSYAEARPLKMSAGEYLFVSHCSRCHSIGEGDKLGPDLHGVTSRRESDWLVRYVNNAQKMLAARDPIAVGLSEKYQTARMPNMRLDSGQVKDLIEYLKTRER
jgi:protein SCO1/2